MKARFEIAWKSIRENFWFIPGLFSLLAFALTLLLPRYGAGILPAQLSIFLWPGFDNSETAHSLLGAIIGSSMTVTGVVFSVTISVLVSASTHYGTGLLPKFIQLRSTQVTLGLFLSSFLFAILLYPQLSEEGSNSALMGFLVSLAVVWSIVSFGALLHFIHAIIQFLQPPSIISRVYQDAMTAICSAYPEKAESAVNDAANEKDIFFGERIYAESSGFVLMVDSHALRKLVKSKRCHIKCIAPPGSFVHEGSVIAEIACEASASGDVAKELRASYVVSNRRDAPRDPNSSIEQLVEIAVRALSPGINAPYLAIESINRIVSALRTVACRAPHKDISKIGEHFLIQHWYSYQDLCAASFNLLSEYAKDHLIVQREMLEGIGKILPMVQDLEFRTCLMQQAEKIVRQAKALGHDEAEIKSLEQLYLSLGDLEV